MSERKLLTARQLKITEAERVALLRVRQGLAEGRFVHRPEPDVGNPTDKPLFNMGETFGRWECGQIGCIGGWMGFEMAEGNCDFYVGDLETPGGHSPALHGLFFPHPSGCGATGGEWSQLTPRQAVRAIDKFLASGAKYPWRGIISTKTGWEDA